MSFDLFQMTVFLARDRSAIRITVDKNSRVNSAERIISRTAGYRF